MSTRSINNERTKRKYTGITGSEKSEEEKTTSQQYYTGRRTAASGKPAREKAAGVRVTPSSDAARYKQKRDSMRTGSKEERKAKRQELRDHDSMVDFVGKYLMHQDPEYPKMRRIWWILLAVGFTCVILAWIFTILAGNMQSTAMGTVAIVFMILSYVLIIAAVVYDFFKIGKMRRRYGDEVRGYTDKKLKAMIRKEEKERLAYIDEHGDGLWEKFKRLFR